MAGSLENKVALVTGGGSGIGEACAMALAREGAKVVVADVEIGKGQRTIEQLKELICKLLVMNDEERLRVLHYGRQFVKESFTPVNEKTLKSFISTN